MKLKKIKEQIGFEPKSVQIQEIDESSVDLGKFDILVRAGLANKAQIQRLHTILEKMHESDNPNLTRADRMIVTNLFNKMVDVLTNNKDIFQKAKRAVKEEVQIIEEDAREIHKLPPILILKRKAIRLFPDGVKVATYYSDKLGKMFTLPMNDLNMGAIKEEVIAEGNMQIIHNIVKNKTKKPLKFADGTTMSVDTWTASAIAQVYDAVNDQNKEKIDRMVNKDKASFHRVAEFAFSKAKK